MEIVLFNNHSCEIYSRSNLIPLQDKFITYGETFREKISIKRIFNKNFKQIFPNEKIKKMNYRTQNRIINRPEYKIRRKLEYNFTKYIENVS
jgi:hypothetical protein